MNRSSLLGTPLAALLLAGGARAEFIAWSYNWTPTVSAVPADSPGTGKVLLTSEPAGTAVNSSDIVASDIRTASSAPYNNPDHFTNVPYGLALTLTDKASHDSGTVTFTGVFNGTLTALSSNITNTFTGPRVQVLQLGGNVYTITMGTYSPPPPPGAVNAGAISAYAQVKVQSGTTGVLQLPEPSALALAGLGLSLGGGAFWRRKRHGLQYERTRRLLGPGRCFMAKCEVCGNDYDKAFTVTAGGRSHTFDSFECAIHALAPQCAHCGCRVVGHGVEQSGTIYCCANCAKSAGVKGLSDRA